MSTQMLSIKSKIESSRNNIILYVDIKTNFIAGEIKCCPTTTVRYTFILLFWTFYDYSTALVLTTRIRTMRMLCILSRICYIGRQVLQLYTMLLLKFLSKIRLLRSNANLLGADFKRRLLK